MTFLRACRGIRPLAPTSPKKGEVGALLRAGWGSRWAGRDRDAIRANAGEDRKGAPTAPRFNPRRTASVVPTTQRPDRWPSVPAPTPVGPYVLDFYCPRLRLAIELDGGQHNFPGESERDRRRELWLAARGITVLRFWNSDVIANMAGVLEKISILASEVARPK